MTLLQCVGILKFVGIRLPMMMGGIFAAVSPMVAMASNPEIGLLGIFGAVVDQLDERATKAEDNKIFEECLVDARRMSSDLEYLRLFNPDATAADLGLDPKFRRQIKAALLQGTI